MIQDINSSIGKWDVTKEEYETVKNIISSVVYDDYDLLVQLCDALALPTDFCLLEKRFVDVACKEIKLKDRRVIPYESIKSKVSNSSFITDINIFNWMYATN